MLDSLDRSPLYIQIAAQLRAQIRAGRYVEGSKIPSEHELSARFQVGRPTVRQATSTLVQERVLERRRGSGTYVANSPPEVDLFSAGGTLASFQRGGVALATRLLGRVRRCSVDSKLEQPFAGRSAFFLTRQSSMADVPVLLEEMYFDPEVFPDLDRQRLSGHSISALARERYQLRPLSTEQRFSVVALDGKRAARLSLPRGKSVLKVERTLDFHGAPRALFAEIYARSDQVAFTQRFFLDQAQPLSAKNTA